MRVPRCPDRPAKEMGMSTSTFASARHLVALSLAGALLAVGLGPTASPAAAQEKTLVVGANFVIKSLDPGRTVETTSYMINHAAYDSLVTFDGEDLSTPKPSLAT